MAKEAAYGRLFLCAIMKEMMYQVGIDLRKKQKVSGIFFTLLPHRVIWGCGVTNERRMLMAAQMLQESITSLLDLKKSMQDEIDWIDGVLLNTSRTVGAILDEMPAPAPVGPVDGFEQRVYQTIAKADGPVAEDAIAILLLEDGYQTDLPPEELVNTIMTEAIQPLLAAGRISAVGERPHRQYLVPA